MRYETSPPRRRRSPPNTIPPTNAAMKPEPPIASASPKPRSAPASGTTWSQVASTKRRPPAWTTTAAATAPATTPPRTPYPIFSSTSSAAAPSPIAPSSASATASATKKSGTQIPSFSPLSTLRLWRMRVGRRGDVTTAWPSAASVGARMIARSSASGHARSPRSATPTTNPARIVSGRPIPSRRAGIPSVRRSAFRSMRDASEKRTTASVASASVLTSMPVADGIDETERLDADDEPGGGEDHRRSDPRALDATRDRREAEEDEGENGELPVHARSFAEVGRATNGCLGSSARRWPGSNERSSASRGRGRRGSPQGGRGRCSRRRRCRRRGRCPR